MRRAAASSGALVVGAALVVSGGGAYAFLVLAARALGPVRYSSLSALWSLVFLVAPGVFIPVEQELARAIGARRARSEGSAPVVARAARIVVAIVAVSMVSAVALAPLYLDPLFDGSVALLVAMELSFAAYGAYFLARGVLSGSSRLTDYAWLVGAEGVFRLLGAAVLVVLGVHAVGAFGLMIPVGTFLAVLVVARRGRQALSPGPPASWREITVALGLLMTGSVVAQLLVNAGPIIVKALADAGEQAAAGRFLAGLVLARIPLFLFQAVQAAVLPRLSGLVASGRLREFRRFMAALAGTMAALVAVAGGAAFLLGPRVARAVFGEAFALGRRDLTLLAVGSGAFLLAQALAQGIVALQRHRLVAASWLVGLAAAAVTVAFGSDLILRVGSALVVGSATTAVILAVALALHVRPGKTDGQAAPLLGPAQAEPLS